MGIVLVACCAARWHTPCGDDDVDLGMNQFGSKAGKSFVVPLGPSVLDHDALPFHVAVLAER